MGIITQEDAPHYWVSNGTLLPDLHLELRHGNVFIDVLVDYKFRSTYAKNLKVGDIVDARYQPMANNKQFFAVIRSVDIDTYTGTVEVDLDKIDSKIHPLPE
jgi:hypothetical protein